MLTNEDLPLFTKEAEKLGVPNFGGDLPLPYGLRNTEEWYYGIAAKFGKSDEAYKVLQEGSKKVRDVLRFNYSYTWQSNLMLQKRAALIGRAHFIASMARCLYYDMAMYPEVIALQAATKESVDRVKKLLESMEKDGMSPKILINPPYVEFARAVEEAEVDLVLGSRIEKTLIGGMGIAHHAIGSSYYFNTFRYLPMPYVGYEGILYLLQELGLAMEDMFHEREAWKRLCYKNI